jgi:hypothetical protein
MNLISSYVHPTKSQITLGPFQSIRLSFDGLRGGDDKALLAAYHKHQWAVNGLDYFRLDCTDRVVFHFERAQERSTFYGPYERFSAVNGLAYCDDQVVTFLDPKKAEWLYYDTGYHWPVMVISDPKYVR